MEERMAYEPYIEGSNNIVEAGVLIHSNRFRREMAPALKGMARMFKELKIPYNVYDENGTFDDVKLLVVEESARFDEKLEKRLCDYVKNGGKIIFSGAAIDLGKRCGLLDYIDLIGPDPRDNAYYTVEDSDMRWAMYDLSRIIKNVSGKEMAKYVDNVVNFTWDGRQSCYYRPQGEKTEYSAVVLGENTACICFNVFRSYIDNFLVEHRDLVKGSH